MSFNGLYYPAYTPGFGSRPRLHSTHPFRNLVAAGSNMNNQWSNGNSHTSYGLEPPDYDYHSGPSAHVPSGGSYSYHATGGSGYGPPAAPPAHPPAKPASGGGGSGGGKKGGLFNGGGGGKRGSSAMSALTLLSFLFFINLLQGCIKDHMDAMSPTVMVMTPTVTRNRFNKMGEINSREQTSTYTSNAANIVMQPADLVAAAAAQSPPVMDATRPSVNLHSPYSNTPTSFNKPVEQAVPQAPAQYVHNTPEPEVPINYAKPQYDPQKLDPYDHHLPQPQQTTLYTYANQTLAAKPPTYKLPPAEQHYNYHHTEYYAQSPPQPSIVVPQYTHSLQNTFHEPPYHPVPANQYNDDSSFQYSSAHQGYNLRQKHEMPHQQQNQHPLQPIYSNEGPHPWSTNLHASSVVSGPFRRASVVAVSPKTRWISVPAKITDRTNFDGFVERIEEDIEHHDDRDVFHSRLT